MMGVGNRDYHYLSRFEIDGGKRISQHLSGFFEIIDGVLPTGVREVEITVHAQRVPGDSVD